MSLTFFLPLIAQIGPGGALPQAPLPIPKPKGAAVAAPSASQAIQPDQLKQCLDLAMTRPSEAIEVAQNWLASVKTMKDRAGAQQCHAMALVRIEGFAEAAPLFLSARTDTPANEADERARLAALAGNALLAAGAPAEALAALDLARSDAVGGFDAKQRGGIEIDRARALVALNRPDEAAAALAEARIAAPANHQAWLLSATLARRQGKLADAQIYIERAAQLFPVDPEIGLEAGVIAVLSGHDEAARKSWLSVIKAAPGSPSAKTAQAYLDQLGPADASPGR
jgi:tetratricopeptide (TPR) repeat protein